MTDSVPREQVSQSGTEKASSASAAFKQLPDEIIEQILAISDPDTFASLVLLNRQWRDVSQQAHLYARHLAQCPSYAASHSSVPDTDDEALPRLRRFFAREVKRNLFEAYLRPSETIIKLVSTSISSSSCPGGEGMRFSASPRGHHLLAYNSARIYVIDVRNDIHELKRELKVSRLPISACIKDDGTFLAVLSSETQVDLYSLETSPPRRTQSFMLDNCPRAIALSPCASVLAAAYDTGIEVSSLSSNALPTDKRAVKCDAVDALSFSVDGTQILGTTTHSTSPSTVVLTAPYYDPGTQATNDSIGAMWTTSILFPNTSRDCSHAVLLQDGLDEEACWTFTYDRSFETFRAVRVEDLRNGTTYFTGPTPKETPPTKLLPSTLPAASFHGDLVAAGFQGKEIWLYGIPEDLDAVPETANSNADSEHGSSTSLMRRNSSHSGVSRNPSNRVPDGSHGVVPKWQVLCDKLRNTFITGRKVAFLNGASHVKWVAGFGGESVRERLVVGARGVNGPRLVTEEDDMDFVDGGRIALLDFDYRVRDGQKREITIEVGSDDAEVLEEEQRDLETEVAIVRRRTVAQKRGGPAALLRAATTGVARSLAVPPLPQPHVADEDPLMPRRIGHNPTSRNPAPTSDVDDGETATIEEQEALDAPYAHSSPRSGTTLRRAATAAAVNRTLNPRLADGRPIEYRRADGRAEHPHESDADNWVPPPPPYQKDDPGDLPAFLRGPVTSPLIIGAPQSHTNSSHHRPSSDRKHPPNVPLGAVPPNRTQHSPDFLARRMSHPRRASDSTTTSRSRVSEVPRPMSSPSVQPESDDIYDVSPPESPRLPESQPSSPQLQQVRSDRSWGSGSSIGPSQVQTGLASSISAGREHSRSNVPSLGLQIPGPGFQRAEPSTTSSPSVGQLASSQTWPVAPRPRSGMSPHVPSSHPYSAPAAQPTIDELTTDLPPLPSSSQLASLNKRTSQGHPRRLSGGHQIQRVPVGSRSGILRPEPQQPQQTPISAGSSSSWQSEPEQPLIISTPHGVIGSFDPPQRRTSGRNMGTPILAPIPRHPRPNPALPNSRPTVERLETIYSTQSGQFGNHVSSRGDQQPPRPSTSSRFLPSWLSAPSASSSRTSTTVNRKPSRAERSAAKNLQDAKRNGWKAKTKKNKKKKKNDYDGASSTGAWTDISFRSTKKDKQCVVM